VRIVLAGTLLAALLAASSATAESTPANYRAALNGVCRYYTPKFKVVEARMKHAEATKNAHAVGEAVGEAIGLALYQDHQLETIPVPSVLAANMRPILALMHKVDTHARRAVVRATYADVKGMVSELKIVGRISAPLDKMFDAEGLRDCGSNQT
jgi:hypothetical protein